MIRKLLRSGVFWMILSVVSGSVAQLFIKLSGSEVSTFLQIFFRFLIGGAVALFILLRQGSGRCWERNRTGNTCWDAP